MDLIKARLTHNTILNNKLIEIGDNRIRFAHSKLPELSNKTFIFLYGGWREYDKEIFRDYLLKNKSIETSNKIWNHMYNCNITVTKEMENKFRCFVESIKHTTSIKISYKEEQELFKALTKYF